MTDARSPVADPGDAVRQAVTAIASDARAGHPDATRLWREFEAAVAALTEQLRRAEEALAAWEKLPAVSESHERAERAEEALRPFVERLWMRDEETWSEAERTAHDLLAAAEERHG